MFGPVGAKVSNFLTKKFGKNPMARPIFPGEKHVVLPTKHGLTRANFAGPGTKVKKRVARGDKGVDGPRGVDAAAKRHDLAYVAARTAADVRRADNRMIRDVKRSTAGPKTKAIVVGAMKGKVLGENLGIFDINTFTQVTEDDNVGKGPRLPADRLLNHVSKHVRQKTNKRKRDAIIQDQVKRLLPIVMSQMKKRKTKQGGRRKRKRGGQVQSTANQFIDLETF